MSFILCFGMKAIAITSYGDVDVLKEVELDEPRIGDEEVLVRVKAVALNHLDIWTRKGQVGHEHEFPHILGSDVSGVVEAVGKHVRNFKVGDKVVLAPAVSCNRCRMCALGEDNLCKEYRILGEHIWGGYREYISMHERFVFRMPENLTFEEASAIPLASLTAYNALLRKGNLKPGETVLILSAGGGVGSFAVQIAKNILGAKVITTVGEEWKVEKAYELGADLVINWRKEDIYETVRNAFGRVDMVLDHTGSMHMEKFIKLVKWGGRIVIYGATSGYMANVDLRHVFYRQISIIGSTMGRRGDIYSILGFVEDVKLKPIVFKVFPFTLEGVKQAHKLMESGKFFGKIVLSF